MGLPRGLRPQQPEAAGGLEAVAAVAFGRESAHGTEPTATLAPGCAARPCKSVGRILGTLRLTVPGRLSGTTPSLLAYGSPLALIYNGVRFRIVTTLLPSVVSLASP